MDNLKAEEKNVECDEKLSLSNSLERKKVLITGGSQGIGLATACELARKNYDIVIVCRNEEKAEAAVHLIRQKNEKVDVSYLLVDFANLETVQALNNKIISECLIFDVVILNAGVLLPPQKRTVDGIETTFQVNYLAQYLLLRAIVRNKQSKKVPLKVVTLTSIMYKLCGMIFHLPHDIIKWNKFFNSPFHKNQWRAYALSKFAMALLASSLNRHERISAIAIHPGCVNTNISEHIVKNARIKNIFLKCFTLNTETAAKHVCFCVENDVHPDYYRYENKTKKLKDCARNERNIFALEQLSEELTRNIGLQNTS